MTPDTYTISEQFLDVGDGHQLYIQDWGNKNADLPIIFLHGGPGGGCSNGHKQTFDPRTQRVIFFDQRGAGKSLPKGELKNNTTKELVEDIEKIAQHFKLDEFILTGGSWGSCLAFAYGLKYPKRVRAMVLRGIYTGTREETEFIDKGEWKTFYPEVWDAFLSRTPKKHHDNPSQYHYENFQSDDPEKAKASSYAFSELEGSLLSLDDRHTTSDYAEFDPDGMKIELHYLKNDCFMPDKYIFDNASKLTMPIWLVQGRYDMVCPPITAYALHQKLPNSKLIFSTAGHRGGDRGIYEIMRALLLQLTT